MPDPQSRRPQVLAWSWSLDADDQSAAAADVLLSNDEKARAGNFMSPRLRQRFAAGRARLRSLLGGHLGRDPRALVFVANEFGKPRLAGEPSVHFSLSHSEGQALLAVSDTLEVGADVERIRVLEHRDLAKRYFHPNEVAAIERVSRHDDQLAAFFRTWTLKEAVVKALGKGLSIPLDTFEVSIAGSRPMLLANPEGAPPAWWLYTMGPLDGYCRGLAVPGAADVELIQRTF